MEDYIMLATEDDRAEILALYKTQVGREYCPWNDEYPGDDTITFDLLRDALFVMKRDGKIIAAISIEEDEAVDNLKCWSADIAPAGELARVCVMPGLQGEGIGRKMMNHGMKELKNRGFRSVHFIVNKYNIKAIKSYEAFDFDVVGECHMYEQDFLCYEKEL